MYQLKILPAAQRDLDLFHGKVFEKIKKTVMILSNNPRPFGAIKLANEEGYRVRIGNYRVLYRVEDKTKEIFIYRIKHRKEVYR